MFRDKPSDRSNLLRPPDATICVALEFGVPPLPFTSSIEVLGPGYNLTIRVLVKVHKGGLTDVVYLGTTLGGIGITAPVPVPP